jgi:hypothetical protein
MLLGALVIFILTLLIGRVKILKSELKTRWMVESATQTCRLGPPFLPNTLPKTLDAP